MLILSYGLRPPLESLTEPVLCLYRRPAGLKRYHRKKGFMRSLVTDSSDPRPYVFHWSWTAGKHEKLK